LGDGVRDFQDGRQRFVFNDNFLRGGAAGFLGFADDEGDDLAVIKHLFVSEQNFVVTDGADVVDAGHIFGEQTAAMSGMVLAAEASRRESLREREARRRTDFKHVFLRGEIVGVDASP